MIDTKLQYHQIGRTIVTSVSLNDIADVDKMELIQGILHDWYVSGNVKFNELQAWVKDVAPVAARGAV